MAQAVSGDKNAGVGLAVQAGALRALNPKISILAFEQKCKDGKSTPGNFIFICIERVNPMKTCLSILFLSICLGCVIRAQEPTPKLLSDAARCLVDKTFLKPSTLSLGYLETTKDWPGEEVLYVVSYTGPNRLKGFVFTIFVKQEDHHQVLYISNNAKFVRTNKSSGGVDFIEDPLGGIWTQEHLVSAIKQIEKNSILVIPIIEIPRDISSNYCHSYADRNNFQNKK